jgi:multiple antibiotic resistance protein
MFEKLFFHFLFGGIISLITITNPLSKIPLFIALTERSTEADKRRTARQACIYAFCIMVVCLFAGTLILEFFGISYGALRVAGGITVAVVGFRMLFDSQAAASNPQSPHRNIAFFPLALPSISGPGVIAVVIGISTEIAELSHWSDKALAYAGTITATLLACLVVWLTLRSARFVQQLIGAEGMEAMTRMMGFLLICVGVQFIGSGIRTFIGGS